MGCGASAKPDYVVKLDEVEAKCKSAEDEKGQERLGILTTSAQELDAVMDILVERGSKDTLELQRVQYLSDVVLKQLEGMVDGLSAPVGESGTDLGDAAAKEARMKKSKTTLEMQAKIVDVGKLLDKVRATKASILLQDRINSLQDKGATSALEQVRKDVQMIREPAQLAEGLGNALAHMEEAHGIAPSSKKVTDNLLKFCVQLSSTTLKFLPTILNFNEAALEKAQLDKVVEKCKDLDELAMKLVIVMESKWDPPLAPGVEAQTTERAMRVFNTQIPAAEASLKATGEGGAAFGALQAVKMWWPILKKTEGCSERIAALLVQIGASADKAFQDAKGRGDEATCKAIAGFAGEFDKLSAAFDGCTPADGAGLEAKLAAADVVGDAAATMAALEAEVSKASKGALNRTALLSNLEALSARWAEACKVDDSLAVRLETTCATLESLLLSVAVGSEGKKAEELQKLANEYDQLRPKVAPPEPSDGALCPRLTSKLCEKDLTIAEEELAKANNLNPNVVNEALQRLTAIEGRPEDVSSRIEEVLRSCQGRVIARGEKAVEDGQAAILPRLLLFAAKFDDAASKLRGPEAVEAAGETLTQQLELLQSKLPAPAEDAAPPEEEVDAAAEADAVADVDAADVEPAADAEAVAEDDTAEAVAADAAPAEDAADLPSPADGAVAAALLAEDAIGAGEPAEDAAPEPSEEEKAAATELLNSIDGHLGKDTGMNPHALLEEIKQLATIWSPVASSEDFLGRIVAVYEHLAERLIEACRKAAAEDQAKKLELLFDFTKKFQAAQEEMGKPAPGFLGSVARAAADTDLADAEVELAKESGMNTMAVLKSIQNLRICWSELGEPDETTQQLHERFSKVCDTVRQRMNEAFDKVAGDSARQARLITFAGDFDSACSGLEGVSELGLQKELQDKADEGE